jgi:hypothetical protein
MIDTMTWLDNAPQSTHQRRFCNVVTKMTRHAQRVSSGAGMDIYSVRLYTSFFLFVVLTTHVYFFAGDFVCLPPAGNLSELNTF